MYVVNVYVVAPLFRHKLIKMIWIVILIIVAVYLRYRNQLIVKITAAKLATMMENIPEYTSSVKNKGSPYFIASNRSLSLNSHQFNIFWKKVSYYVNRK